MTFSRSTPLVSERKLFFSAYWAVSVICSRCNGHVKLDGYNDHINTCTTHLQQLSPSTSINDVLQRPLTSPLTPMEQKLQTSFVRRSMSGSPEESVLQLKKGGKASINVDLDSHTCNSHNFPQLMTFVLVKQTQKPTRKVSPRTVCKQSHSLASVRLAISAGDCCTQFAHEFYACSNDRTEVLEELRQTGGNFLIQIPADTSLASKANLNIP